MVRSALAKRRLSHDAFMLAFFAALISSLRSSLRPSHQSFFDWLIFSRRSGVQVEASLSRRSGVHGTISRSDIIFDARCRRSGVHFAETRARFSGVQACDISLFRRWISPGGNFCLLKQEPSYPFNHLSLLSTFKRFKTRTSQFRASSGMAKICRISTTSGSPCSARIAATRFDDVKYVVHRSSGAHFFEYRAP